MCEYVSMSSFKCGPHPALSFINMKVRNRIKVILYTDDSPHLTYQIVSVVECDWHTEGVTSLHDGAFRVFVAVILHSWTHRSMEEKWLPEFTLG